MSSEPDSLHISRQDLTEYKNHAQNILKALEEAEAAHNTTGQCEIVQVNCKSSLDALGELSIGEMKKPSRLRRLLFRPPTKRNQLEKLSVFNTVLEEDIQQVSLHSSMPSGATLISRTSLPPPYSEPVI
jgi:hypothetical protein